MYTSCMLYYYYVYQKHPLEDLTMLEVALKKKKKKKKKLSVHVLIVEREGKVSQIVY